MMTDLNFSPKKLITIVLTSLLLIGIIAQLIIVVYEIKFTNLFPSIHPVSKFTHWELLSMAMYHLQPNNHKDITTQASKSIPSVLKIKKPNIVLILFDDAGYGDLGANIIPKGAIKGMLSHTPFIDDIAWRGLRLTDYYVTSSICTPSRASMITGRYGQRTGITDTIFPTIASGLPSTEITMATMLKKQSYDTIILGKWHLGHHKPHDPLSHGFDEWLGLPLSNDFGCTDAPLGSVYNVNGRSRTSFACPSFSENTYSESKWVKEGRGYASVLPLYHGCSPTLFDNVTRQQCHSAVDRTLSNLRELNHCNGKVEKEEENERVENMIREQPTNLWLLSERLVSRARSFILEHSAVAEREESIHPFFLYFPLIHTHVPHHPTEQFLTQARSMLTEFSQHSGRVNKTEFYLDRLVYNAVLLEADNMVRRVVQSLSDAGVADDTLTIVTSDNGPWLKQRAFGGSPFPFEGGKYSVREGGLRVFCVLHWPALLGNYSHIPSTSTSSSPPSSMFHSISGDGRGVSSNVVVSSLDLFPTFASLAQGELPKDRLFDGRDISFLLLLARDYRAHHHSLVNTTANHSSIAQLDMSVHPPAKPLFFQSNKHLTALRIGNYKVKGLLQPRSNAHISRTQHNEITSMLNKGEGGIIEDSEINSAGDSAASVSPRHRSSPDISAVNVQFVGNYFPTLPWTKTSRPRPSGLHISDLTRDYSEQFNMNAYNSKISFFIKNKTSAFQYRESDAALEANEEVDVELSLFEFRLLVDIMNEYIWDSIDSTYKSSFDGYQSPQLIPCATILEPTSSFMCVKCPCDLKRTSKSESTESTTKQEKVSVGRKQCPPPLS